MMYRKYGPKDYERLIKDMKYIHTGDEADIENEHFAKGYMLYANDGVTKIICDGNQNWYYLDSNKGKQILEEVKKENK